jgi:16S rRNA (guanine966-N2)-methyltransferase
VIARGPAGGRYDIAFADPPYALPGEEVSRMLASLTHRDWLAPGALMIIERATRSGPLTWPDGFEADRSRRYGESTFWYGLARRITIVGEP